MASGLGGISGYNTTGILSAENTEVATLVTAASWNAQKEDVKSLLSNNEFVVALRERHALDVRQNPKATYTTSALNVIGTNTSHWEKLLSKANEDASSNYSKTYLDSVKKKADFDKGIPPQLQSVQSQTNALINDPNTTYASRVSMAYNLASVQAEAYIKKAFLEADIRSNSIVQRKMQNHLSEAMNHPGSLVRGIQNQLSGNGWEAALVTAANAK